MNGGTLFDYFNETPVLRHQVDETRNGPEFDATVLALVECEDGPRILDVSFGLALGYERPRDVRKLIERYRSQLLAFGPVRHRGARETQGARRSTEYLLNQGQANYLVTRSDLPNADAACILIAKVFTAWQNGKLTTADLATAVELRDADERLAETSPQMADLFGRIAQCATKNDLQCTEINITRRIDDLAGRKKPSPTVMAIQLGVVRSRYGGYCPCCGKIKIIDDYGIKIEGLCQWDHWYKVTKAGLRDGWTVCSDCNHMLETERTSYTQEFGVFIRRVSEAEATTDPMLTNGDAALLKGMS